MFVNRIRELNALKKRYQSNKFEFIVIYGRRRIGKSSLILESIKGLDDSIYFQCNELNESLNIIKFKETISKQLDNTEIFDLIDDWEVIFRMVIKHFRVIIIDEFPYLIESNRAIKSIFQRIIDQQLIKTQCTLVLMGSSIKMMESDILGVNSPLYGRRTAQMKLDELDFVHIKKFLPNYCLEDLIRIYGVTGGVPYYLEQMDPTISFWENIENNFLNTHSVLFAEGEILLKQEFKQISTYMGILLQIASGVTDISNIKNKLKQSGDISSYLSNLKMIELIERRLPLNEDKIKSRRGRYYIKDNFLKFWFQFIFQNRQNIFTGLSVIDIIKSSFAQYMGYIFEKFINKILIYGIVNGKINLPFKLSKLESWWYKDMEFDLIGWNTDYYLFIEIKWQKLSLIDVRRIVNKLIQKSNTTKFSGEFSYMIAARKIEGINEIEMENVQLIDLSVIEKWFE